MAEDVLFVPVSFSYERVFDSLADSDILLGEKDVTSTSIQYLKNLLLSSKKNGNVFVNFGKALSLKQSINSYTLSNQLEPKKLH